MTSYFYSNFKSVISLNDISHRKQMTNHREYEPPQVPVDGQVDHFLDRVKIWVIQVPQEPQHTRSEHLHTNPRKLFKPIFLLEGKKLLFFHLSEKKDEGGKVEDINHPDQPVQKQGGTRCRVKTLLPVFQCSIKHVLQNSQTINILIITITQATASVVPMSRRQATTRKLVGTSLSP